MPTQNDNAKIAQKQEKTKYWYLVPSMVTRPN